MRKLRWKLRWQEAFIQRFVVLPDDVFSFLCEQGTEVNARVRIEDDRKTVAEHALWYEESLPTETILAGVVWCDKVYGKDPNVSIENMMKEFCSSAQDLQLGGKASVGKGQVRCLFSNGGQDHAQK